MKSMPEAISKPFQHLRWSFFHEMVQAFPLWEKGMGGRGGGGGAQQHQFLKATPYQSRSLMGPPPHLKMKLPR